MKRKQLIAMMLVLAMVITLLPGGMAAAAEAEDFRLEFEVYQFNGNLGSDDQSPQERWGPPIDLTVQSLNVGDIIMVAVKYSGLSNITDYGIRDLGINVGYDFEYFQPMAPRGNFTPPATVAQEPAISMPLLTRNWVNGFMSPDAETFGDTYSYDASDAPPLEAGSTIRCSYFQIAFINKPDPSTAINADSAYIGILEYEVKKATPTGAATNLQFVAVIPASITVYNSSSYITYGTYNEFTGLPGVLNNLTSEDITITNPSWMADISTADITKNYAAGTANLESGSNIVINNLIAAIDGSATKPVGSAAAAQLYDQNESPINGLVPAAGSDIDGYTITLSLPPGADQDFTIVITERDGADPSESAHLLAASQKPDVAEANILKRFAADGTLGDNNGVRVYTVGDQPVDGDTIIHLYLEDDITDTPYGSFSGITKDDKNIDYVFVGLAGLTDDVYYLTAQQGERVQTPYATPVDQFLSLSPAEVEVINNYGQVDESNSYMLIKTVQAGGTTPVPARAGTEFRLYEVVDTAGTKASGKPVEDITQPIPSEPADEGGVKIALPRDIMTKEGTEYYLSATEPNQLESDKALIGAVQAGITILDILDPDDELDPDDQERLAASGYKPVPNPIIVIDGTTPAQFDSFALLTVKVPVKLESVKVDEDTGKDTWIDFVAVTWDGLPDESFTKIGGDGNTEFYTLTAEFDAENMAALGLLLPVAPLTVTVQVVDPPTITLNRGNALESDLTDGYATSLNDVFVYYQYGFRDSGYTVTDYDGDDITSDAVVTRSIMVDEVKTDIGSYATDEILTDFSIDRLTEYSKHYTITYEYVDPVLPYLTAVATREVYVIYQLGDINRDGEITVSDSSTITAHTKRVMLIDLSDRLYKDKTCDVNGDGELTVSDESAITAHLKRVLPLIQMYDVNETNKIMMIP